MFGHLLSKGLTFLTDGLKRVNRFAPGISQIAKGVDSLGVGGGTIGRWVDKGLSLARKGERALSEFGMLSKDEKAKLLGSKLGEVATRGLGRFLQ